MYILGYFTRTYAYVQNSRQAVKKGDRSFVRFLCPLLSLHTSSSIRVVILSGRQKATLNAPQFYRRRPDLFRRRESNTRPFLFHMNRPRAKNDVHTTQTCRPHLRPTKQVLYGIRFYTNNYSVVCVDLSTLPGSPIAQE